MFDNKELDTILIGLQAYKDDTEDYIIDVTSELEYREYRCHTNLVKSLKEQLKISNEKLEDINNIIDKINQINKPNYKRGDMVLFVSGRMIGLNGKITDIDKCDLKRPLMIKIEDCNEVNNCTYFCNYDEIEVIKLH